MNKLIVVEHSRVVGERTFAQTDYNNGINKIARLLNNNNTFKTTNIQLNGSCHSQPDPWHATHKSNAMKNNKVEKRTQQLRCLQNEAFVKRFIITHDRGFSFYFLFY